VKCTAKNALMCCQLTTVWPTSKGTAGRVIVPCKVARLCERCGDSVPGGHSDHHYGYQY
jgi:hypothetical protein